jgi:hypothetical protein
MTLFVLGLETQLAETGEGDGLPQRVGVFATAHSLLDALPQ